MKGQNVLCAVSVSVSSEAETDTRKLFMPCRHKQFLSSLTETENWFSFELLDEAPPKTCCLLVYDSLKPIPHYLKKRRKDKSVPSRPSRSLIHNGTPVGNSMKKNEDLRQKLIFLKWAKMISYKEMALRSGLGNSTIYNFVTERRNGGLHKATKEKLLKFIEEEEKHEKK